MKDQIKQLETFVSDMEKYLEQKTEQMLSLPIPELTKEKFDLYQLTGNRRIYELDYFGKRKFLAVYGVAAMRIVKEDLAAIGNVPRQAVFDKLEEAMLSLCHEECWALPAHVTPVSVPADADWHIWIDLFAAETAETLAHLLSELGTALSENCRQTVRREVFRRALDPYFHSEPGYYYWERKDHNWNAVCNGALGCAYLHMLQPGEPMNREYVGRICDNLLYYIGGFSQDGTCMEGMGYYTYGMSYFAHFAQDLYRVSGGEIDLLRGDWGPYRAGELDKRSRIAGWWPNCFFASGRLVSFSDCCDSYYRMGLACTLASRFPNATLVDAAFAANLDQDENNRFVQFYDDYYATKAYIEQLRREGAAADSTGEGSFTILEAAQWCIGKAKNGVGLACKAGHNGEMHNHNDVGSFHYVVGSEMPLLDLGAGEYTKDYFTPGVNESIFCISSRSHNVPVIDGKLQRWGKEYGASGFAAKVSDGVGTVSFQAEGAYGPGVIARFDRQLAFRLENGAVTVTDIFENPGKALTVTESLATYEQPQIGHDSVKLMGATGGCLLQVLTDGVPVTADAFRVTTHTHVDHFGQQIPVQLLQWDICVEQPREVTVHITPVILEEVL